MTAAIFVAVVLLTGGISLFAISAWLRAGGYVCLVVALLALWWTALGHPRPAFFGVPKGTVLSYTLSEPKSIDVMVRRKSGGDPVLWELPWSEKDAAALLRAAQVAKATGRVVMMRGRHGDGRSGYASRHHGGPVFYAAPTPQLPAKRRP